MGTIRKAVIAAAGLGTRMFPITKVIEKAMLPIGRRPTIDYIVRECAAAGVGEIAIVVRRGSTQIQRYYGDDTELRALLGRRGWAEKAHSLDELASVPSITFIEQDLEDRYGTAVPVLLARDFIGDDAFFFLSGDDLLVERHGRSTLAELGRDAGGGSGYALVGQPSSASSLDRYGRLETAETDGRTYLTDLVEKDAAETRPEGGKVLINISRYAFPGEFLPVLAAVGEHEESGEYRLTDGLVEIMRSTPIAVTVSLGSYFDLGNEQGLAEASRHVVVDNR
ncbi:sugar phosphate nucleotidyltransferase [Embleya hyalina]|uniref:UTP--glucose-1-phosphate uridylyltransferase n=1 Tax=Embleya hyalina TaxID=516124 RepID=A0A401YN55_9ACTN|nr:sugar phosphate nucleotidyltransferase [Embleya hyalina]GCD96007.1 UTP--glucose-1-phosphate uridylyltransferase [Embleya hyalina]